MKMGNSLKSFQFILIFSLLSAVVVAQEVNRTPDGNYTTPDLTEQIQIGPDNSLLIRAASNLPGKLDIRTSKTKEVKVVYRKKARSVKKSNAVDYIELIALLMNKTPESVRLEIRAPNPVPWDTEKEWGMVEADIVVPENCLVRIEAPLFDVIIVGPLRTVEIPSSLGRLDISGVTEKLNVSTANRRVSVTDITGEISISTSNSVLTAKNLNSVDQRADIENEHGDIRIEGFAGEINVQNSYGRIFISSFKVRGNRNIIRCMSGPIVLGIEQINNAQIRVTNKFEDIELTLPEVVSAMFSLAVDEGGKIELTNIDLKPELIERNRMNLVSGQGESLIASSVRGSGNIYVRGYGD